MAAGSLEHELAALETLQLPDLRQKWTTVSDAPVPRVSAALLRYALAFELQARVHGGLSRRTRQKLDQLADGATQTRDTRPGMRLMREWNGTLHVVTIEEDGAIVWNERTWGSLSSVARAITGTRWSGPAFFGLKERQQQRKSAA
ncbi:DUF2924 domain-containing protein [Croceicoccus ponticola]|uniref:DUF2924 domain-containing protein n=1 Tax=Croceicoccus ponticola TaxID=2217664 RepID=A0A437GUS9_9SPHN|nr:DUF2924 domain-containing protein [Croceicoccus ponticola]RVQ64984.1 DUF2924 domain-containing protein [Croceicoccus ponticola]